MRRYPSVTLGLILLAATVIRGFALLSIRSSIYFDVPLLDERLYHVWATKIVDGTFQATAIYEFAPLPAYLLALLYRIFSPDIFYFRLMNVLMGIAVCYLTYLAGRQLAGEKVGLISALIAALYKPYIFYSVVPLKTTMSIFTVTLIIYFLLRCTQAERWPEAGLLGIALGALVNIRPNAVVLLPAVPLFLAWSHWRRGWRTRAVLRPVLMATAGIMVALAPFTARNASVSGEFAPTTSQSGFHLYMCNRVDKTSSTQFASTSPYERGIQFTIEASRRVGKRLTPKEASAYWTRETLLGIWQHPLNYMKMIAKRFFVALNHYEQGDHYQIEFMGRYLFFFRLPFLTFWMIMPLAMAAILLGCPKSRSFQAMGMFLVVYGATLVIFFTNIRVRLATVPVLIPCSAYAITRLFEFRRQRDRANLKIWLAATLVFLGIAWIPFRGNGDMTAHLNTRAIILNAKGQSAEALVLWEESARTQGHYSAYAQLALAKYYFDHGDAGKAFAYLDQVGDDSFAAAQKFEYLGDLFFRQHRIREAVRAYEKSLYLNGGNRTARQKLMEIFRRTGDWNRYEAESVKYRFISSFYSVF